MHHYAQMMLEPQSEHRTLPRRLARVAQHYRDAPATVLFELLNRPNRELGRERWNEGARGIAAGGAREQPASHADRRRRRLEQRRGPESLRVPAGERNLIATFHYYEPMAVTHQGAEWVPGAGAWVGTRWRGTPAERQRLRDDFDRVSRWAAREQRPVLLGEFGAYSRADDATRIAWTRGARKPRRGSPGPVRRLASSFGVLEPLAAVASALLDALLPARWRSLGTFPRGC